MLEFTAGVANTLQADIDRLIEELCSAIPAAFEYDDYGSRKQVIEDGVKERQRKAINEPVAEFVAHRILAALDASAQSLAALKTAVMLAAESGADLEGFSSKMPPWCALPICASPGGYCSRLGQTSLLTVRSWNMNWSYWPAALSLLL